MQPDNRPDRPACALSLSPLNIPNPYLGWMVLSEWGAQSVIDSFSGAVPCDVVMPGKQLHFRIEDLAIEENQLLGLAVADSPEDMGCVAKAIESGEVEPVVRIELRMPVEGVALGAPARIDQAVLTRVRFELVPLERLEEE